MVVVADLLPPPRMGMLMLLVVFPGPLFSLPPLKDLPPALDEVEEEGLESLGEGVEAVVGKGRKDPCRGLPKIFRSLPLQAVLRLHGLVEHLLPPSSFPPPLKPRHPPPPHLVRRQAP